MLFDYATRAAAMRLSDGAKRGVPPYAYARCCRCAMRARSRRLYERAMRGGELCVVRIRAMLQRLSVMLRMLRAARDYYLRLSARVRAARRMFCSCLRAPLMLILADAADADLLPLR